MKYNKKAVALALALVMTISMAVAAFAQTAFEQDVARAIAQAEQKQQQREAVVNVTVYWTDNQAQYIKKECKGILTQDANVLFPAACLQNKAYALAEAGFTFSNGNIQPVAAAQITQNADMASVAADAAAINNLKGLPVAACSANAMRPFFKQFLLDRGVLPAQYRESDHENRLFVRKEYTINVGDPVIYQGKVIALVKKVPFSLYGKAENYFACLH